MPTRLRFLVAVLAVSLLSVACASDIETTRSTNEATNVVAATASGGQIDFGSLEGSDTVLWFWAPW